LDVVAYVEGQHGPDGDVILKHLPCSLLDGDDTF
jgi:hypothetical protein